MRNLLSAAALLGMLAAPAVAQTTTPSPDRPATPPAATAPSTTSPSTTTSPSASSGQLQYYTAEPGQHRATKLIGTLVKNSAGETVGDINEIILSKDGKAAAAVIGVGGFLGMGEREVAVSFPSLTLAQDADGNLTVMLPTATKDSLKAAPEWKSAAR